MYYLFESNSKYRTSFTNTSARDVCSVYLFLHAKYFTVHTHTHSMSDFLSRNEFHHQYFPRDMFILQCAFIITTKRHTHQWRRLHLNTITFLDSNNSVSGVPFCMFPSLSLRFLSLLQCLTRFLCPVLNAFTQTRAHTQWYTAHTYSLNSIDFIATCNKCAHLVNGVLCGVSIAEFSFMCTKNRT